jgi:type VII secretion protein EccB
MPSTPTTKSQVQAYRFVLRRMQSALVRKDAVMLHDPMRTHSRATIVGVCLAALGLLGFLIWGILSPKPTVPNEAGIVIGKPSGQVYVLMTEPRKQLVPVFNLASARLFLYQQTLNQQGGSQGAAPAAAQTNTAPQVYDPTFVDDNELRDQPRTRKVGIADGPDLLPSKDQRAEPQWTVCDQYIDKDDNEQTRDGDVETTVIAGVSDRGPELDKNASLLVQAENGDVYLVYRTPGNLNDRTASTVRAEVDLEQSHIRTALGINEGQVRNITTGLLNSIPEKAALETPDIPGIDNDEQPDPDRVSPDLDLGVGAVFSVQPTGQARKYYVVKRDGVDEIKRTTGDLIRFKQDINSGDVPSKSPQVITDSQETANPIDDSTFPDQPAEVLLPNKYPVACLGWSATGPKADDEERTTVHVGTDVPGVPGGGQEGSKWVNVSTPGSTGVRIQHFYMPPGRGAVVRQATSNEDFETGPITLVSDRGVKYGIPNAGTLAALGLADPPAIPAPQAILSLLPDGASMDPQDVEQSYDTVPIQGGEYPTKSAGPDNGTGGQAGGG